MGEGAAALAHAEMALINVACDDPGATVGLCLVLPLLQQVRGVLACAQGCTHDHQGGARTSHQHGCGSACVTMPDVWLVRGSIGCADAGLAVVVGGARVCWDGYEPRDALSHLVPHVVACREYETVCAWQPWPPFCGLDHHSQPTCTNLCDAVTPPPPLHLTSPPNTHPVSVWMRRHVGGMRHTAGRCGRSWWRRRSGRGRRNVGRRCVCAWCGGGGLWGARGGHSTCMGRVWRVEGGVRSSVVVWWQRVCMCPAGQGGSPHVCPH